MDAYLILSVVCWLCVFHDMCHANVENVALEKSASMTSVYDDEYPAYLAVNGNTGRKHRPIGGTNPNCANSGDVINSRWEVDLGKNYTINSISVYTMKSYETQMYGVLITVDDMYCYNITTTEITERLEVTCNSTLNGRRVQFTKYTYTGRYKYISFCEVQVWVCKDGYYGSKCSNSCGNCSSNQPTCDPDTGHCLSGCQSGWHPPTCHSKCTPGLYGVNCSYSCGKCINNQSCDRITGHCPAGCQSGWQLPECHDACLPGWYGTNCTEQCGNCHNIDACNSMNGACDGGCREGFEGSLCKEVSAETKNDRNGENMNAIIGAVVSIVFTFACSAFAAVAIIRCRRQLKKKGAQAVHEQRKHIEKSNPSGLQLHESSIKPESNVTPQHRSESTDTNREICVFSSPVSENDDRKPAAHKHLQSSVNKPTQFNNGCYHDDSSISLPVKDANEIELREVISHKSGVQGQVYYNVTECVGRAVISHNSGVQGQVYCNVTECEGRAVISHNSGLQGQVYCNVTECEGRAAICKKPSEHRFSEFLQDLDDDTDDKDIIYNNEDIYSSYQPRTSATQTDALESSLLASLASGELSKRFKELPKQMNHPCIEGLKPENLQKNRFKALCPYDHTRVKLQRPDGDEDFDYINASYIKGYHRERAYIAAQGPRIHTIDDFWLMIWQENITHIVMLTNLQEDGKNKCDEYWPQSGSCHIYGHVTVTGVCVQERAGFVIRTFSVTFQEKPIQRQVDQYHFETWPDHGVPTTVSLVNFWRYVKARALPNNPLLVHCSAGVGRTGTFIALDIAMEMAVSHHDVNVHRIVTDLREERCIMVQTEAQYTFLHEVILEAYTSRACRLTFDQFDVMFPKIIRVDEPNHVIDTEFRVLQQMGKYIPKPRHDIASSPENIGKNRNVEALSDDSYLALLKDDVKERSMYINAVFLSSLIHRRETILTQLPLPETLGDIWRLVDEYGIQIIVAVTSKEEKETIENYCQYWPTATGEILSTAAYSVVMTTTVSLSKNLTSIHLQFQTENCVREIRLLHFSDWTSEVPDDTEDLIRLVESLDTSLSQEDKSPVLVQCLNGCSKSGLFCIVWDVLSRAMCDHEIDVYLSARHVQRVKPQAITSEVQYRFCYKAAQDFLRQLGVYQNT